MSSDEKRISLSAGEVALSNLFCRRLKVFEEEIDFVISPSIQDVHILSAWAEGVIYSCNVNSKIIKRKRYINIPTILGQFLIGVKFLDKARNIELMVSEDRTLGTWKSVYYLDFITPLPLYLETAKPWILRYESAEENVILLYAVLSNGYSGYGNEEPILIDLHPNHKHYIGASHGLITILPKKRDPPY